MKEEENANKNIWFDSEINIQKKDNKHRQKAEFRNVQTGKGA